MILSNISQHENKISIDFGKSSTEHAELWPTRNQSIIHSSKIASTEIEVQQSRTVKSVFFPEHSSDFQSTQAPIKRKPIVIPSFTMEKRNHPRITSIIRKLIDVFGAMVVSKALQSFLPVEKMSVTVTYDPPEERTQVVLQLFTEANASQSIGFWDSIENDIQSWLLTLSEREKLIFIRDISLRIHWK